MIILALILHYSKGYKEGFFDFPDVNHNIFIQNSQAKFNELTNTINLTDPAIPVTPDSANAFKIALSGLSSEPTNTTYNLGSKNNYTTPNNLPNNFQQAITCEAAPTTCDAFDDPTFAANCGMSFDKKGISVNGKPHIGGLFISPDDRKKQMDMANNVLSTGGAPYDPYKVYQPTLGKAKPGSFALNKDQCQVIKERIDCATKQTFSSPNCTQCYTSQNFSRVGPETGRIPSTLYLFGSGTVNVSSQNNIIYLPENKLDTNNPMTVLVPANAEGTVFHINLQANPNSTSTFVAGYIEGQTPRGTFKLDILNLVQSDLITNTKPKINGSITVNGFRCLSLVPGTSQTKMDLSCLMPFSFLSMYDGDALTCDNGPIITQAASATFLESDPCFGKANKPGNYKLECLQSRWIEMGGTPQGIGYPSNQTKADALQKDANGKPLDIDTIVNNLAPKMTSALTGQDANGNNLSISNWNTVSMWATGTPINTPCDGPNSQSGPLSQECLQYLYLNQGINSHIGPTYTLAASSMASMLGQKTANTYCQPGTSLDPSTPAGLKFAQGLGGINAVKQTYDQINRLANDNTLPNDKRSVAINQCYGVNIDTLPTGPAVTVPYTKIDGGYLQQGNGGNISCFSGLTLEQAQAGCNSLGSQCVAFSYATGPNKDGCYKGDINGGMVNTNDYVGYVKGPYKLAPQSPQNLSQSQLPSPQGVFVCMANNGTTIYYTDSNLAKANMSWTAIPTSISLATFSVAPNGSMFATSDSNLIFFTKAYNNGGNWMAMPGSLAQIATDGNIVVGVNSSNLAFTSTYAGAASEQWTPLAGITINKIVTSGGQYYAIGTDGKVYYYSSTGWNAALNDGRIYRDISFDNGVVILVGTDNNIYYLDSQLYSPNATVTKVPNQPNEFAFASVSNGSIYAIGGGAWYTSNYKNTNWVKLANSSGQLACSHRVTTP